MILVSSCFLVTADPHEALNSKTRVGLTTINALIVCASVGIFETRQILFSGLDYLKSMWNINDILLFLSTCALLAMEVLYLKTLLADNDDVNENLRILKPKKKPKSGGGGSSAILDANGNAVELPKEHIYKVWIRILYVAVILTSFFKVLNIAQIFKQVGYLVQMLVDITKEVGPFF